MHKKAKYLSLCTDKAGQEEEEEEEREEKKERNKRNDERVGAYAGGRAKDERAEADGVWGMGYGVWGVRVNAGGRKRIGCQSQQNLNISSKVGWTQCSFAAVTRHSV